MVAAISLFMLIADGEHGAEIFSVANKLDQAKIIYKACYNMVQSSPILSKKIRKTRTSLEFGTSELMPLASDSNSLDGLNPHMAAYDEGHATKTMDLYDVLDSAFGAMEQPLFLHITTAGTVRSGLYDNLYERSSKVLNGTITDDSFLPFIYELDTEAEYTDPEMWIKANPNLGISVNEEYLAAKVEKAKTDASARPGILTKHFNLPQTSETSWLTFDTLNNEETYNEDDHKGLYCIGGADLSSTTDLTAATLMWEKDDRIYVKQMYWLPSAKIQERTNEDKVPYDIWIKQGIMRASQGNKINYSDVTEWFVEQVNKYDLRPLWVGYDSWNAQYWCDEMRAEGFDMVEVRQGAKSMSTPMKQMEADLADKKINYNNNPILKWCMTNVSIETDKNDNIRPVKGISNQARIDGVVRGVRPLSGALRRRS